MSVQHQYQIVIAVTKENRKKLEAEYDKRLAPGDTLALAVSADDLSPSPTLLENYSKVAAEHGGVLEYRSIETVTSAWVQIAHEYPQPVDS